MTSTRPKPKSSHITKYSQPLELVSFLVILPALNVIKIFLHAIILNNCLFNYLIFSGLTFYVSKHLYLGFIFFYLLK